MLIDAAERNGVYIPRFCYHPRMKPVGMCRMCLVEVDTGRGPALQPSCMLEVADGMSVDTESAVTKKAQDGVLEFLLINHPLDCPVCDKGGECPLQDQTMAYGPGESRFVEEKRHFEKPIPISDLVYLDRERCILCDRCTRFAKEVAGDPLIHFLDRGNQTQVNTFPGHPFASYFSGNTVQICPVGALTAKPYRFKARPWDLDEVESTCTSCSFGCRVTVQSSRNQVLRYLGVDADPVNWGWMCDKGRFDFEAVNSEDRLGAPLVRDEGLLLKEGTLDRGPAPRRHGGEGGPRPQRPVRRGRDRRRPAHQRVRLRLGQAGQGHHRHRQRRRPAGRRPARRGGPRPAPGHDRRGLRPRRHGDPAGPDPKEELPVLHLRLRHAVENDGVRVVQLTRWPTARPSWPPSRSSTGPAASWPWSRPCWRATSAARSPTSSPPTCGPPPRCSPTGPVTVVLGRSNAGRVRRRAWPTPPSVIAEGAPRCAFLSGLRRRNVHGALDMGLAPGLLPGRVTLDDGRDWFGTASGPTCRPSGGSTPPASSRPPPRGASTRWCCSAPTRSPTSPTATLAERGLAGARTVIAVDQFLTDSVQQADVVLPAAGYAEVGGHDHQHRGPRHASSTRRSRRPGTARPTG